MYCMNLESVSSPHKQQQLRVSGFGFVLQADCWRRRLASPTPAAANLLDGRPQQLSAKAYFMVAPPRRL